MRLLIAKVYVMFVFSSLLLFVNFIRLFIVIFLVDSIRFYFIRLILL